MSVDTAVSTPAVGTTTVADLVGREVLMPGAKEVARVARREGERVLLSTGEFVDGEVALVQVLPHVGERVQVDVGLSTSTYSGEVIWLGEWESVADGVRVSVIGPVGQILTRVVREGAQVRRMGDVVGYEELVGLVVKAHRAHQGWVSELVSEAHVWADDNDLCERFDDFMEEHGLARRVRDYEVSVTIERLNFTVEASSEEEAEEMVTHEWIRDRLEEMGEHFDFDVEF